MLGKVVLGTEDTSEKSTTKAGFVAKNYAMMESKTARISPPQIEAVLGCH